MNKPKLRIAFWHFYTFRLHRGIETLILGLSNALSQKGAEISIVSASRTLEPLIKPDPKVKVHAFPTGRFCGHQTIVPWYVQHFLRYDYDEIIVFFADFGEGRACRLLDPFKKLPLSLYLCYPKLAVPHRYESFLKMEWQKKTRHVIADAAWIANEAAPLFGREVPVVPVGTDIERFKPDSIKRKEMREKWGYGDKDVILLNVSSLEKRKGTWRVIEAIGRLKEQGLLKYFILGSGIEEKALKSRVRDLGIQERIIFGRETSRLEDYYNMADIFVMLPDAEGNSVACHEAMASCLPVLVSNKGGFLESVPSNAGLLVDPDDTRAIDAALRKLIAGAADRLKMGEAGRAHVTASLTWEKSAEKFLEIFTPQK